MDKNGFSKKIQKISEMSFQPLAGKEHHKILHIAGWTVADCQHECQHECQHA